MKLKLFGRQVKMSACVIFLPVIWFVRLDPSVYAGEMIVSLADNFKMRFIDFRNCNTNTHIIGNPLSIEVICS
jgi:hypothetical protein